LREEEIFADRKEGAHAAVLSKGEFAKDVFPVWKKKNIPVLISRGRRKIHSGREKRVPSLFIASAREKGGQPGAAALTFSVSN